MTEADNNTSITPYLGATLMMRQLPSSPGRFVRVVMARADGGQDRAVNPDRAPESRHPVGPSAGTR